MVCQHAVQVGYTVYLNLGLLLVAWLWDLSLGCSSINFEHSCSSTLFILICMGKNKLFSILWVHEWMAWWTARMMASRTAEQLYGGAAETRSRSPTFPRARSNGVKVNCLSSRCTIRSCFPTMHVLARLSKSFRYLVGATIYSSADAVALP